ncbi:MAG: sulfatase-like hydrolase/transferase [Phycisphaerales bacterium]|nr:sulfatase-like hydrolase/transferase [Phycisphaerales bacterium]
MHRWKLILVGFAVALLSDRGTNAESAPADPPSVVLVIADDAGWIDFGFHGSTEIATPELDRLATESVVLEACYVTASVCSPSRAGMLTGRYQQRCGHEYNLPGEARRVEGGLPLTERTIADRMRAAGYATGLIGKWHLGLAPAFHPTNRGFDEFHGFRAGSRSYFGNEALTGGDRGYEHVRPGGRTAEVESEIAYLTDTIARDAVDFIRNHADRPSFLVVAFNAPHGPMHATEEDLAAIDPALAPDRRRTYAAMMRSLDRACGSIADAIDASGRDTMLIFVNDNGGATNNASDNGPWRGMKGSQFEGGIRVPGFVRRPAALKPGSVEHPVSTLDLMATAVAIADGDQVGLDGVDLDPWLRSQRADRPHQRLFWRRGPVAAVRDLDLKLIRIEGGQTLLFDLHADPRERQDLSSDRPSETIRLLAELAAWEYQMMPPRWTTGPMWRKNLLRKHRIDVVGREAERAIP